MRHLIALMLLSFCSSSWAVQFRECGIYEGEGVLRMIQTNKKNELFLVLNEHAESETRLRLGTYPASDPQAFHFLRAKLRFRVLKKCSLKCEATLEDVLTRIEDSRDLVEFNELKSNKVKSLPCLSSKELATPRSVRLSKKPY